MHLVVVRLLLLFLLVLHLPGQAQHRYWDADYDSLRLVVRQQRTDTARLRTIVHLIDLVRWDEARERQHALALLDDLFLLNKHLRRVDDAPYRALRKSALHWAEPNQEALALAAAQQAIALFDRSERPIPRLLIEVAPLYNRLNQLDERYFFYRNKLAYYRVHGAKENIAACYLSIGGYYRRRGAYNQAISNFLRAAELFKTFDQRYYISELKVAGANYAEWGNSDKALQYLRQSVALARKYAARGCGGVDAYTLRNISKLYLQQRNTVAALRYANMSLAVRGRASLNIQEDKSYGLVQKSLVLLRMNELELTRQTLQQAQHLADSLRIPITGRRQGEFELIAAWAQFYAAKKDYAAAEAYWQAAYWEATDKKLDVLRKNYLRQLSSFYDARNKPVQAQQYSRAYIALADSMSATQGAYHLAQYEGERLEQTQNAQIAHLRQERAVQALHLRQRNQLLIGALVAIIMVSGLGALMYRQLRENRRTLRQLRQTQSQLIASEKWAFVGELSAGIAHELQNPLSFMKKFAEVSTAMIDGMALPHGRAARGSLEHDILTGLKQNLQEISQHGVRASSIIKDMLEHSRAGTGQRALTALNPLVEEYLRLAHQGLQGSAKALHTELLTALDPTLVPVWVVPQDIGRVLLNLFTNAFHAVRQRHQSEPGYQPTVSVHTLQLPAHIEIRVSDTGAGIPESLRARIFEPFFTTKPAGEGTGLGLSLSVDIIKSHGGTLRVETQEGVGTQFIITLPT
ncbi:ATP-binding protein [Hymenobacter elongatus]|uniref:histidine kinase n=1 Tax=Hymenobacter elongatus TaxID=877208 RepID=A0A4Z0PLZ5_9BACT|nr:ATP-binding protein [Hymenobacter elongatus]TGE17193.1 hypothetical protein E5J99_07950 [Hymenobacter elongatus]